MYEKEASRQLRDNVCYKRLTFNPLSKYKQELAAILELGVEEGVITQKQFSYLLPEHPAVATLYLLPKIHKGLENPPGRPIVAGNNSLSEPICRYIDHFLKPIVESLPSYLRDTTDILRRLDGIQLDQDALLVTCDVEALYTSIRHADGLEAVEKFLLMTDFEPETCQFLRMKRICSSDTFFEEQAKDLTNRFKERGYRQQDISKAYSRAKNTPRNNLLMQPKQKNLDNQGATEKSKGTCSEHRSSQE
ncbi:uncharacterized protein LOC130366892 [Hyla sarda]|uniref:uncharacterized protein LOC130366892 n=1 Tax=Hyla sarda TaxID=327740 RepID=UPI0024C35E96|nr:uncharacterized protein LOC130366892 [Hyla sarda]